MIINGKRSDSDAEIKNEIIIGLLFSNSKMYDEKGFPTCQRLETLIRL
jgi:hypothetical protein